MEHLDVHLRWSRPNSYWYCAHGVGDVSEAPSGPESFALGRLTRGEKLCFGGATVEGDLIGFRRTLEGTL